VVATEAPITAHAAAGSCPTGGSCVSWAPAGAYVYGFSAGVNDTNYSNNYFNVDGTLKVLANDIGSGRNRTSYTSVYYYTGTSWTGSGFPVPNDGLWYSGVSISTESHWLRIQSYC